MSDKYYMRITIFSVLGILLLVILAGTVTFFLSLEGEEQIMVPDVVGKELSAGLIDLQEKSLSPYIQLRYSSDPTLKGKVMSQKPHPGTLVKAGKTIELTVSRGAIVDRVGDYRGQDLNEVKIHLQTLFTTYKPLLKIKEPVIYVHSDQPVGTILEQKPEPETEITGLTEIELVVSRGSMGEKMTAPEYTGMGYAEAVQRLSQENIPFFFTMKPGEAGENAGTVVSQNPEAGTEVPFGSIFQLEVAEPERIPRGYVKGLFECTLPDNFVSVDIKLEAVQPDGEKKLIFAMRHPGGSLSIPYVEPQNTDLILSVLGKEVIRQTVVPPRVEE